MIGLTLLADVRVVDFTQALSGPYCTMMLADLGADVTKVEPPERGDDSRRWGPPFVGEDAAYFMSVNRNKRSVALDLKSPDGMAAARDLVAQADVVVENWRPGTADRLGLGAARLRADHPTLVHCSISGFGQDQGPRSGYDQIVQGTSGVMSLTGPIGEPTKWGVPAGDIAAGMFASNAIVAALYDRRTSGVGRSIDIAMQDCLVSMLTHQAARYLNGGGAPGTEQNGHATIAPYGLFRARDGFLNLCVGNDSQFRRTCEALACQPLLEDERFRTNADRVAYKAELVAALNQALSTLDITDALIALDAVGVPAGRVRDVAQVLDDDATTGRGMLLEFEREDSGPGRVVNTPWKFDGIGPSVRRPPPRLGEHTAELTRGAGTPPRARREPATQGQAVTSSDLLARARTFLFVPGDRPDRFARALDSDADCVVVDLEDAVAPRSKHAAREHVASLLQQTLAEPVVVRVNQPGTPEYEDDLRALAGQPGLAGVMLPKADSTSVLREVSRRLGVAVLPLVETAAGILAAAQLALVPGVARLVLGHLDLAAELGIDPADDPHLAPARFALVVASAAAGLPGPVDGASIDVRDTKRVAAETRSALAAGCTARLCVHPDQVAVVHAALAPDETQLSWARSRHSHHVKDVMNSVELSTTIAEALAAAGADTVFGMPGGGANLDLIGAAEAAGLRFVLAHAETPAAIMAAVYADLTDTPAACVVTRGPGAASAVNGVANALLDRQQLILVTDTVSAADRQRVAHQRIDQTAMFAPVTKWSGTAGSGDTYGTASGAIDLAMAEPRGPVHLDADPAAASGRVPSLHSAASVDPADLEQACALLTGSRRPLVLLGVGARRLVPVVRALLRGTAVPALMTYRAKGVVPDSWPNAAGLLTGATTEAPLLEAADLIVSIGVDSVELIPNAWPYAPPVVSVSAWAETSPYLVPKIELVGGLGALIEQLAAHLPATTWAPDAGRAHRDAELARLVAAGPAKVSGLSPQQVVTRTRAAAPAGTVATVDSGAHMLPTMALWDAEEVDETLISSGLATMGFSVPAAVGAALARPDRRVVCFTGDGGLGMSLGELETIKRLGLPITVVVFNDSRLSLIAIKAKPKGHGGENAIGYASTDFAAVARGYGLAGERATTTQELDAALAASFTRPGATLVDACVDPIGYPEILNAVRGKRQPR